MSGEARRKARPHTDANFVTVCEPALGFQGPVSGIAPNVEHGYEGVRDGNDI